ncbi:MAG TPA: CHAT domain-containing protein, partial [Blastocatellia bacterium]|nr:CHAT domain-containing protein [Blastocatellia bacterium]
MSSRLADKLLSFSSEEEFLNGLRGKADWRTVARLKSDVDHLIGTDVKTAARVVDSVEKLASFLGDSVSDAYARISRARLLYTQGQHLKANELYNVGVKALHGAGLRTEAAMVQVQQIDSLKFLGRYDDAIRTARTARQHLAKAGKIPLAQLETNLGNVYFHLDRYKIALQHYDRARAMLARTGAPVMRGLVDFCRSCVYIEMDQPDRALKVLESAGRAHQAAGKTLISAQVRCQAAYIDFLRGNFNSALATYYSARERLVELGSEQDIAFYSLELAEVLLALNAFEDSAENAEKAQQGFSNLGMSYELGKSLQLLGLAKTGLQEYDSARDCLVRARRIFEKSGNSTFAALTDSYLAELALRRGRAKEAAGRAEKAFRVFSRQKLANRSAQSRLQAAVAAKRMGDETRALRLARIALKTVEGLFAPGLTYKCHHLIGQIERSRGDSKSALQSLRRSIDIVEELRGGIAADEFKGSFLRDKIEVYEDAIRLCLDSDDEKFIEEAFRLVELSKSRALADLVARYLRGGEAAKRGSTQGPGSQVRARLLKLIEDLNWYSSNAGIEDDKGGQRSALTADRYQRAVARCERQIAQLFRRMQAEGSSFGDMRAACAVTSQELREGLGEDESVLEYFMAGDEVCAFIATRSAMKVVRGVAQKAEVEQLLSAMRFQTEKFNYGSEYVESHFGQLMRSALEHLSAIYECAFKPIESEIRTRKLVIIPHGQLHYVPFHALYNGRDYLLDRFE